MRFPPIWYLQKSPVFSALPEEALRKLCAPLAMADHPNRSKVLINDAGESTFYIARGAAKLVRRGIFGRRIVETVLCEGDLFGSISGMGVSGSFVLEAVADLKLCAIPSEDITRLVRQHPEFAVVIIQSLEDRQRVLRRNVESLLYKDLTTRVVEAILWLAREHGDRCEHGWAMDVRINQQDLADLCGATRQSVSSVLGKLERRLLLRRKGHVICILSMTRLAKLRPQPE